jgi:hypothetical protein
MKLIDDIRHWWRLWSVRFSLAALLVNAIQLLDPTLMLTLLGSLRDETLEAVPPRAIAAVQAVLIVLAITARFLPQKLPERNTDGQ